MMEGTGDKSHPNPTVFSRRFTLNVVSVSTRAKYFFVMVGFSIIFALFMAPAFVKRENFSMNAALAAPKPKPTPRAHTSAPAAPKPKPTPRAPTSAPTAPKSKSTPRAPTSAPAAPKPKPTPRAPTSAPTAPKPKPTPRAHTSAPAAPKPKPTSRAPTSAPTAPKSKSTTRASAAPTPKLTPRDKIWGEACPTWSPPTSGLQPPVLTPEQTAEAQVLTKILRARLDLPNDLVMPNFSKPCDVLANDTSTYLIPPVRACTTTNCTNPLNKSLNGRVKDIIGSPELQLTNGERKSVDVISQQIPENDVIIVTAASSNHFGEVQKMFKSLHEIVYPRLKNFSVVFMDIGLTPKEKKLAEKGCRCKVISFPYEHFPPHVKTNICYSFKPISVLAAYQKARKLVVWMDASIRWTEIGFRHIFDRAMTYGSQILRYSDSSRVTAHTLRPTFDYMKREVCAFTAFPEIDASVQVHLKDPVTTRLILEPWAKCCLERCCICPVSPGPVLYCSRPAAVHRCQRFDQSAMTLVLARLFNDKTQQIVMPNMFNNVTILYKLGGDQLKDYFK